MKKETKKIYVNKPRNINMLKALLGEYNLLHLLKGKQYDPLIDYIIKVAPLWNDDNSDFILPTIKKISEELNEKRVHSWLPAMVDDLIKLNNEHPDYFNINNSKYMYHLHAKDEINELSIEYNIWTDMPLREGERFYWPFSQVRLWMGVLWIKEIFHCYSNGNLKTDVYLEHGTLNMYREFIYDRALFENKISSYDSHTLSEYKIDKLLLDYYSHR